MDQNSVCGGQGPERHAHDHGQEAINFTIWICISGEKIRMDI